jgi:Xaa-Pro dipeptidase
MDVHEPINLVGGEKTPLAPGMCFSNEPGIYIHGAFGVRLEDCFYMTSGGPRYFSRPPPSIDQPFA